MSHSTENRAAVVADLESRIEELESLDEEAFGGFTRLDWVCCVLGAVLLPYAAFLWFWR